MQNKSHKYFEGVDEFSHKFVPKVGVLLVNLGTPDAPDTKSLRKYLREFLSDPRIIELPKFFWKLLLESVILRTRPRKVARLYQSIWTEKGSPLLVYSVSILNKIRDRFVKNGYINLEFALGMRYGNPSIKSALLELKNKGCTKIIFLPLFGQYSSTTVGSAFDAFSDVLKTFRWVPDIRTINYFHDEPGYIESLANKIKASWERNGRSEKLLLSFHGVPLRYVLAGDPYHCHCHKTARLLGEKLGLSKEDYVVSFQSQFGKEEWVKPATDQTIEGLAGAGLKSLDIICPGFICDCLETLEEIAVENRDIFIENGGEKFNYIPCLNDSDDLISTLFSLIEKEGQAWISKDLERMNAVAENTECLYQKRRALNEQKFY